MISASTAGELKLKFLTSSTLNQIKFFCYQLKEKDWTDEVDKKSIVFVGLILWMCKSKNINQLNREMILELLGIDYLKNKMIMK